MTTINARFRIRGVTTGSGAPADHMWREIAANESNNTFWYGYGVGTGDQAAASHLMFRSDGTRLWHDIIGASDGSTVFVGDGSSLTGVTVGSVAWSAITSKPTTLAGYGITDAAAAGHTHAWGDITGKPSFATVATSGAYSDLTGIPATFAPAAHTHGWADISSGKPTTLAGYGITDAAPLSHVGTGGTAHASAVASGAAGFMTGSDKAKLDGIASGAQVNTVTSVAGKTGAVTLVKGDVGLGSVDNTADASKAVASAATWTTARTLTIGGTGKSVNGSAAVSWSLGEIGAAAASHTHTASEISDSTSAGRALLTASDAAAQRTALALGDAAQATLITSSTDSTAGRVLALNGTTGAFGLGANYAPLLADLDQISTPAGFYFINMNSGTTGTSPGFSVAALIIIHSIGNGTRAPQQIAIERSNSAGGKMAWRTSQGGTWGAWQTVAAIGHNHAISDVTGLQAALDAKQPAITTTEAVLTSDVSLTADNTWTDAVTLALAAGTWMITSQITMQRQVTKATTFMGRISDGTTHYASGQQYQPSAATNNGTTITMHRVITLTSATTIRLQGLCTSGANGTDNRIIAQLSSNASGDTATILTAAKMA